MKRILLLSTVLVFALSGYIMAQKTVTGTVTAEEDGSPVPGVNVIVKGTSAGTVTDIDGNYQIGVPDQGGILVFSFIGLATEEVEIGAQSVINMTMTADIKQLNEIVVTATGDLRNANSVTYANQTVGSESLLSSPQKNTLEALRGKAAGVKLTTNSGSVGASTRIVLRGEASLTGNNNALIVIDGIPIDNSNSIGGENEGEGGYTDYGNAFNDLDPQSIESVTILKGPSATSLYGSRGASGVVMITTKSGSKGKMKVDLNTTFSIEDAYILLDRQEQFGQGILNPDGSKIFDSGENFSWGPRFDGITRPWTSPIDADGDGNLEYLSRPYEAVPNQLHDFFRTGWTSNNSLALSGGTDLFTYRVNYANTFQNGIMHNTDYERHNIGFNGTAKLSDKVSSSVGLSYASVAMNTATEGSRAFEGRNPYASAIQSPNTIDYRQVRDYTSPFHDFGGWYGTYTINPYFILNEMANTGKRDNWLGNASIDWKPIKGLTLATKFGINYTSLNTIESVPIYQYEDHYVWLDNLKLDGPRSRDGNAGAHNELLRSTTVIDWTTTASYTTEIGSSSSLTAIGGVNIYDLTRKQLYGETRGGLVIPGVYNLANSAQTAAVEQSHNDYRIIGFFGNASYSWKDRVYLEGSVRNDYSSTLPVDSQSFLYWSLGSSVIVSDFLNWTYNDPISKLKVRVSYGTTGKDAGLYLLTNTYNINPSLVNYEGIYEILSPFNGQTGISKDGLIGNNFLTPEVTTTFEAGTDITFWKGRGNFSYTYYNSIHTDQILEADLSRASGYSITAVNIGELTNKGHEISLNITPISTASGFDWDLGFVWSTNKSEVTRISAQTNELSIWSSGRGVTQVAAVGEPFGTWKGNVQRFDPNGNPIVDGNGARVYTTTPEYVGSVQPDFLGSITTSFKYKGFRLGALLDGRKGGKFFSLTKTAVEFNGTGGNTLIGDRQPFIVPNSVVEQSDGTFVENTTPIVASNYLDDGNYTNHLLDASFLKLREISLGYTFPREIVSRLNLQAASIDFFAKNVKFWLPSENIFDDPEAKGPGGSSDNTTGVASTQTPPARSYGVSLNLTF
ncbi:MAG: SusC/RagA family TonB-linked outer membrane protein [Cyclobacteriaceae bacterium]|nr:SusC/RagA family TonB-linked outer membrane protein [Cyclobacteriaceae bacterium]